HDPGARPFAGLLPQAVQAARLPGHRRRAFAGDVGLALSGREAIMRRFFGILLVFASAAAWAAALPSAPPGAVGLCSERLGGSGARPGSRPPGGSPTRPRRRSGR